MIAQSGLVDSKDKHKEVKQWSPDLYMVYGAPDSRKPQLPDSGQGTEQNDKIACFLLVLGGTSLPSTNHIANL